MGRCIGSIGKLGVSQIASLVALLSILYIVSRCVSVSIRRWMAWYLDLIKCQSNTSCFLLGDSRLLANTLSSCPTSVAIHLRWSLKSNMGFIWTPSILYELFGGRYSMLVPS